MKTTDSPVAEAKKRLTRAVNAYRDKGGPMSAFQWRTTYSEFIYPQTDASWSDEKLKTEILLRTAELLVLL